MSLSQWLLCILSIVPLPSAKADPLADVPALAVKIDGFISRHWQDNHIKPAPAADDAAFLRRITLDLVGRIPTRGEGEGFAADQASDKRAHVIRRLMASPEFALHFGRTLDDMIQEKYAGKTELLEYLRSAVAAHTSWDQIFREMMLGPWDTKERKLANQFLAKRIGSLDDLTNDTARIFFGVNVSCAKCHDHPLVPDWTQDHYYGMASFFIRTQEGSKGKRNAEIGEKTTGEVSFVTRKGERRSARLMFLSGRVLEEPVAKPKPSHGLAPAGRRAQLVRIALEDKNFFSRALVNRLWAYFLGRGLVQPLDQMHSANPPAIPDLLEWLGDDFAGHGYNLERLVAAIVSSRVYQLASAGDGDAPSDRFFARALLRPLTPHQYALSMVLAVEDGGLDQANSPQSRARHYRDLEGRANRFTQPELLDRRTDKFQSSAGEALFLSNNIDIQNWLAPTGKNLVARLAALKDTQEIVKQAVLTVLSRQPDVEERSYLAAWLNAHQQDRAKACGDLVWALLTSAEFRFNH